MSKDEDLMVCKHALGECINALVDYIERLEKADRMAHFGYGRQVLRIAADAYGGDWKLPQAVRDGYERLLFGKKTT